MFVSLDLLSAQPWGEQSQSHNTDYCPNSSGSEVSKPLKLAAEE